MENNITYYMMGQPIHYMSMLDGIRDDDFASIT